MFKADWIQFFLPGRIRLEHDSLPKMGAWAVSFGQRAVIIKVKESETDYDDEINIITASLKKYMDGSIIYDDLGSTPTTEEIDSATYFVRQSSADLIIIIGSVDAINIGKIIALLATNRIFSKECLRGKTEFVYDALPIIVVPIEPTMGEELLGNFIIHDKKNTEIKSIAHESLVPKACFYDPKITLKLTKERASWITSSLLSYCIESALSERLNPFTETLLAQAMTYINTNATNFHNEPYKAEFASTMFWASAFIGAAGNSSPLGINWALGKVLDKFFDLNFYHTQAILLPYIMEYKLTKNPQVFINTAKILGEDITSLSKIEAAIKSVEAVKKFMLKLNMPTSLSEIGFDKRIIPLASSLALKLAQSQYLAEDVTKEYLESFLLAAIELA